VAGNDPKAAVTGRAQVNRTVVDIVVADAVKSVTADPVLLRHFDGESVIVSLGGDSAVKGCVENGHLMNTRKPMGRELDPFDIRGVVKGRQMGAGPDPVHYLWINQVSVPETPPAVYHPVPDSFNGRKPPGKEGIQF
jgi:hypothetical protein